MLSRLSLSLVATLLAFPMQALTGSRRDEHQPLPIDQLGMALRAETVMLVNPDESSRQHLANLLEEQGHLVLQTDDADQARTLLLQALPNLVVIDGHHTRSALQLLEWLRNEPGGDVVAVTLLVPSGDQTSILEAFDLGADDVVDTDIDLYELSTRLRARLERPPQPKEKIVQNPVTGALTEPAFELSLRLEVERCARGTAGCLAYLSLHELPELESVYGAVARDEILAQLVKVSEEDGRLLDLVGSSRGHLALLMPATSIKGGQARLERLSRKIYEYEFKLGTSKGLRLTPSIGFCSNTAGLAREEFKERAWDALLYQTEQLDLHPTRWRSEFSNREGPSHNSFLARHRTAVQIASQQFACLGIPLLAYYLSDRLGFDITGGMYLAVVIALALTALGIWIESLAAFFKQNCPEPPDAPPPTATAIIAAYLPNEADTILGTVNAFLTHDYPDLQIILAYNTPEEMEIEKELQDMAISDPRFLPLKVTGSSSKAQNVNAALASVRGDFIGLFDADHQPAPGSFYRAWRWLADGADVVQGHCVVRNGEDGFWPQLVATEFESIYAVSHPGRRRVHDFGIFGGSNGFWKTSLLKQVRLRGFMLTEDIDSSLRVIENGGVIVSDRLLISTELAPDHWSALWNQRMRWAQGWSQVSLRHLIKALRSKSLSLRQRFGVFHLLGWRELYPWLSLQAFPILLYWLLRGDPPVSWFVPVFVATTLFTISAGCAQAFAAWRLAHPSIKQHGRWFLVFLLASLLFYTEIKNVMARTAHIKEAMGERNWKITPRSMPPMPESVEPAVLSAETPSTH